MKTFKKVCMILISVTAVAGIGCIIAAFVMGADPRQIRNYAEGKTSGKLQTEERNIRADQIRKLNIEKRKLGARYISQMERLKSSRRADILNCFGFNQTMRSQLFCPKELPLRKFPWIVVVETLRQIL